MQARTYLEISPQYHSASSNLIETSTSFATEADGLSMLPVWTSDDAKKPDFACTDTRLGGTGGTMHAGSFSAQRSLRSSNSMIRK